MNGTTNHKSFGTGLTAINEVFKYIDYILEDIFFLLVFGSCKVLTKIFCHVGVQQMYPKLVLHRILVINPLNAFMNKGVSIVQKLHERYD